MADTIRVERQGGYTVLQNHILRSDMSLKAKGLLCVMLSLPEDWDYTIAGLASVCGTGRDAIRSGLKELEAAGYLTREQSHNENGLFSGNLYVVRDTPQPSETSEQAEAEQEQTLQDEPLLENPATVAPLSGKPLPENPLPENPTEQNKEEQSKDIIYPPIVPPEGGQEKRRKPPKETAAWKPERFEAFWLYYRTYCRGENRQGAIKAWDKLKPSDNLIATMGRALEKQLQSEEWQRGIGIPYASTWLNGQRWKDVPKAPRSPDPPDRGRKETYGWQ